MQSTSLAASDTTPSPELLSYNQSRTLKHGISVFSSEYSHSLPVGEESEMSEESVDEVVSSSPSVVDVRGEDASRGELIDIGPSLSDKPISASQENSVEVTEMKGETTEALHPATQCNSPIDKVPNEILIHILANLDPKSLLAVNRVSHKFHSLVTTPHAWRSAFSRFFKGPGSINPELLDANKRQDDKEILRPEARIFSPLTDLGSWRIEYIVRTRLLSALASGRPGESERLERGSQIHYGSPMKTYNSGILAPLDHVHANYETGPKNRVLRVVHGADEIGAALLSYPVTGERNYWGFDDPHIFFQFKDRYPGDAQYGLGRGEMVGAPNVMDVSEPFGMVCGEGFPGGTAYYRSTDERRGRVLTRSSGGRDHSIGMPLIPVERECITSVYICKSRLLPSVSEGVVGILSGSSLGIITAYSLGMDGIDGAQIGRGEITARWALSPGVPIVAIVIDDNYSYECKARRRAWACALNALGEVYYITDLPSRAQSDSASKLGDEHLEKRAWTTGRSVRWNLVELSRRVAQLDPFDDSVDGSFSPRSSCSSMNLSKDQLINETQDIENMLRKRPKHFRQVCRNWDMRRSLQVDFSGSDDKSAGENIAVIDYGFGEGKGASIRRYQRCEINRPVAHPAQTQDADVPMVISTNSTAPSISGDLIAPIPLPSTSPANLSPSQSFSQKTMDESNCALLYEWRASDFSFGTFKSFHITATCLDMSVFATLNAFQDKLLSPTTSSSDLPGRRSRFMAVGTDKGNIFIWNIRAPCPQMIELTNRIDPIRIIRTDSPEIASLALSSLYLVHGGNDGLVQAWDPLASTNQPIRTIHSTLSARARRILRLEQMEFPNRIGGSLSSAAAISLDPDPTALRGIVSIGKHLRYWSFDSEGQRYRDLKRMIHRLARRRNLDHGDRFTKSGRGEIEEYIQSEKRELEKEKAKEKKEEKRLANRFGTEILGTDATEEELFNYAIMLSMESKSDDLMKRQEESQKASASGSAIVSQQNMEPTAQNNVASEPELSTRPDSYFEADMAEAIRLSLLTTPGSSNNVQDASTPSSSNVTIRYATPRQNKKRKIANQTAVSSHRHLIPPNFASSSKTEVSAVEMQQDDYDDLEFAIQLSLAEERSRQEQREQQERQERQEQHNATMAAGDYSDGDIEWNDDMTTLEFSDSEDEDIKGKGKARA